ncbi:GNAT family N-acetyltransferase [Sporosarcina soli]|uniref:GNAT family N-acetyltransferase n=1 Tax=Sporosarcina soli TaxID=334736 RepID=A0ABW0TLB5_9BACL
MGSTENAVTFNELEWDSDFFGIKCAKAILNKSLTKNEWGNLKVEFSNYLFIAIVNQNANPVNAQLIAKDTSAFLADINIQFEKKLVEINEMPRNVTTYQSLEKVDRIIKLADFPHSRFISDPEFAKRGGKYVYQQWAMNAFGKTDKYFMLSKDEKGIINGFVLCSYFQKTCLIELISVTKEVSKSGIGTSLFNAVEYQAYQKGCNKIKVGTQIRNLNAINFYHKVGCKQVECHEVYHFWKK